MSLENVCPFCAKTWDNFHQCAPTKTPLSLDEFDEMQVTMFADDLIEKEGEGFRSDVITGARWQHSKDKAVIQELRAEISSLETKLMFANINNLGLKKQESEIQALKAEIERLKNEIR